MEGPPRVDVRHVLGGGNGSSMPIRIPVRSPEMNDDSANSSVTLAGRMM